MNAVVSAVVGDNAGLFAQAARLWLRSDAFVLDATYGAGRFWSKIVAPRPIANDITADSSFVMTADLDLLSDCRSLPFRDEAFDALVLDPPYKAGTSAPMRDDFDGYHNNERLEKGVAAVQAFYDEAMREAARVLRPSGLMFVKTMDQVESGKNHWLHIEAFAFAETLKLKAVDLFVLVRKQPPPMRHAVQFHSRKNCSYLWVFQKSSARRSAQLILNEVKKR